jgi:hypothetical protein
MGYQDEIAEIVSKHAEEIRADLSRSREALERSKAEVAQFDRRVATYEWLLEVASPELLPPGTAGLTLHDAMVEVLRKAPQRMMRAGDLAAEINRRHLYRMRDGRPVEAQQIHARVGHYPQLFTREGTFIKLAE